jgi:plasmid stabilization system protein ParE
MAINPIIAPEAARDMAEARDWYNARRVGLGDEFFRSVEACVEAICRTPELHERVRENYRRALLRRFPFAVYFEYENGVVTIYSVCHTSRDPDRWWKGRF